MLENIKHQEAYKTKRKYEYTNLAINTAVSIASCFIPLLTNKIKNAETIPPKTNPPVQEEEKENKDKKILSTEEIKKEQEEKAIKYAWQQINGDPNKIDNYFKADLRNHYQKIISDAAQKNVTINPEILNKRLKNYAQAWAIKNQIRLNAKEAIGFNLDKNKLTDADKKESCLEYYDINSNGTIELEELYYKDRVREIINTSTTKESYKEICLKVLDLARKNGHLSLGEIEAENDTPENKMLKDLIIMLETLETSNGVTDIDLRTISDSELKTFIDDYFLK